MHDYGFILCEYFNHRANVTGNYIIFDYHDYDRDISSSDEVVFKRGKIPDNKFTDVEFYSNMNLDNNQRNWLDYEIELLHNSFRHVDFTTSENYIYRIQMFPRDLSVDSETGDTVIEVHNVRLCITLLGRLERN